MMQNKPSPFVNRSAIASYVEDAPRKVPGLADIHRMTMMLLAEKAPTVAHILVVGAGGGMETKALAEAQPAWQFTGVDPSAPMLELARQTLEPFTDRIRLLEGTIDQAPDGPYDGATCLLTLHHVDRRERLRTLQAIKARLKPAANLVVVEHSAPHPDPERWMMRSVAFGDRDGLDWVKARETAKVMIERLPLLSPIEEEQVLREAGFSNVELFYAAFTFRGWVATAATS